MFGFIRSFADFLSGLLRFINDGRLVELGRLRQQKDDESEVLKREKVADEIESKSHNVVDFDDYADKWVPDPRKRDD